MWCSGAGEAPGNVVVETEGPTEISVQWSGLSTCRLVNGAIVKYRVQYRETGGNESRQKDVQSDGDWKIGGSAVLTELTPLTSYSISVAAVNENGVVGVFSNPVTTTTLNYRKKLKLHLSYNIFFPFKACSCGEQLIDSNSVPIIVGVIIGLVGIAVGVSGFIGAAVIARKHRYTS